MLERNMEMTPIRFPEIESLPSDVQYKIAATMVLFEMMKQIGNDPSVKPNDRILPDERSVLVELCETASADISDFEIKINLRDQIGNGHLSSICQQLEFTDENNNQTAQYIAALHYAKQDPDWADHYQANNMDRLTATQEDIVPFLAPRVLPAAVQEGPTLINRLIDFHQQAEYWIGHYDRLDQNS